MIDHIWEGVYQSFREVPAKGEAFHSETWKSNSLKRISTLLEMSKAPATVPPSVAYNASLLPLMIALISEESKHATVLDFGGGLGFTYVPSVAGLSAEASVDYYVVDNEMTSEMGNHIFDRDVQIHFCPSLPDHLEGVDIVHLGSSLQ